jgi:kynureninase
MFVRTDADDGRVYLDGNSLGRPSEAVVRAVHGHLDTWAERLVGGWAEWIDLPRRAGDVLAPLVGARPGTVLVCDSVTVNLFKLAGAVREGAIAVQPGEFPTDRYVAAGLGRPVVDLAAATPEAVRALPDGVGLVVVSHVDYRTGFAADIAAVTAAVHERGARVLWDLSHGVGSLAVDLGDADLAVGCTYKHLGAGPGAPAFLVVREDLVGELVPPIQGWFGQAEQFAMERPYEPAPGIERFLAGTPHIAGLEAVRAGAQVVLDAGLDHVAARTRALTQRLVDGAPAGFEIGSPRDPARRGAHVALRHPDAWRITQALLAAGVVPDFREPDVLRLGVSPLSTTEDEVDEGLRRLREVAETRAYERFGDARARVT